MRKTCSLFLAAFLFLMTGKRDKTAVSAAQKNREICIFFCLEKKVALFASFFV